jgi:uncharacterized protein with ParB-like and HNH nuclease domain
MLDLTISPEPTKSNIMQGITRQGLENFSKLIKTENYAVPRFQRDYSWKEPNWFDLWEDVKAVLSGAYTEKFMGYLVLLETGKVNEIIDGQQRLTTISIMILAFIENVKKLKDDPERDRIISLLKSRFIGEEDVDIDSYIIRLKLNEHNNDLYRSFISGIPLSRRKFNSSEKLMQKCLEWFKEKIYALNLDNSQKIANTVIKIADSLFFTTINVKNESNAYIVFETLNARGVKLSSSDLLKNYLFQKISPKGEDALNDIERKWKTIVSTIGSEDLVDFIRYYWNSRNNFVRTVDLYRAITKEKSTPEDVIKLVDELLACAYIYSAFTKPLDEFWKGNEKIEEKLRVLKLFKLKQPYVPLLIGRELLDDKQFEKLLTYCVAFSMRYNVICDLSANEQEKFYNELALSIKKNEAITENDFKELYPSEDLFFTNFKNKQFIYNTQTTKQVKYILCAIERVFSGNKAVPLFSQDVTIEHIIPQSLPPDYPIKADVQKKLLFRLGNLTLLSQTEQNDVLNYPFDIKYPVYQKSIYKMTSSIGTASTKVWDEITVDQRQEALYKKAKSIWTIPNL